LESSVKKLPGGKVKLEARWQEKMRRPASVNVTFGPLENPDFSPQPLMTGDAKEVSEILHALAEMAWANGWRPRGFSGSLAAFAQNYRLPPAEAAYGE
jgi:hypothetical protein